MLVPRLGLAISSFCKINRPTCFLLQRSMAKKSTDNDEDDKPIPYSSSPAANWKAAHSRKPPDDRVWYTPHVIGVSVAVFMIYFCILREENDIDEIIYRPLPKSIEGIDKLFPQVDFETKPDYVVYHEKVKEKKIKKEETK